MDDLLDSERFNEAVRQVARATPNELRRALIGIGARKTGMLIKEIRSRVGMQFGTINRVSISFPRHLVWIEKGASKGYGGRKGSRWRTKGETRKTDPRSLGKMNTGARLARPTFNPTMDKQVLVLAALMQRHFSDAGARAIVGPKALLIK